MFDPEKGIVGVSIGPRMIFITRFNSTKGTAETGKIVSIKLEEGVVQNGLIVDVEGLARILKNVFRDNNIKAKRVFACISGADEIVRTVTLPKMPKKQMKEALKGEIDKYMLSGEESVIDHYPLNKEKLLLVAIRKDITVTLLKVMEKAGLDLIGIDIFPLAALRALSRGNIDLISKKTTILILIGDEKTDICVVADGRLSYSRNIGTIGIAELIREVTDTISYWIEQSPDSAVEKIVISGDTIKAGELHAVLPDELGVIEQGECPGLTSAEFNLSRAASIGSAMRAFGENKVFDINLLPPGKFKRMRLEKLSLIIFTLFSVILLGIFIASFIFSVICERHTKKLDEVKQKIAESSGAITEAQKIRKEKLRVINMVNKMEVFIAEIEFIPWPSILREIKDRIPPEVWLARIFTAEEFTLTLQGESFSQESVHEYLNLLKSSDYFEEPELLHTRKREEDSAIVAFGITCPLAAGREKER
ncbi:MAG: pilus assembly protein PilM [Candidatus Omnitrophica bacterium]|nr:pilus assembly protein PilM [Candidatus Omnitrophota bacterium]MBU1128388.1 pilus assembly protein PilM [Candidatus Omnitrophota bacterium]MBU1656873.1 pilus assembly protein PilM [Candidatus Omnitrophota bacterium]MBU1784886.1 pilus assembly protein PilM [Candidatus Omnitrophota bacterium]MBU1850866.1 pilus assembly protein PilM [Candidatus Omnitrophota bacterium]